MTVEDCIVILKVHILTKEAIGKHTEAYALFEAYCAIDDQMKIEIKLGYHQTPPRNAPKRTR